MAKRKPTDKVQLPVRMLEMLRADLEKSAKVNGVSLNAEVVARLQHSLLEDEAQRNHEALRDLLNSLKEMLINQQRELVELRGQQSALSSMAGPLGGREMLGPSSTEDDDNA